MECSKLLKEALDSVEILGKDKISTTAFNMPESSAKSLQRAIDLGANRGSTVHISRLPQAKKQDIANMLFSSRDMSKAKGLAGNQSLNDVDYFGTTTKMKPFDFLQLAQKRGASISDKAKRKDFAYNIVKELASGKESRLGPPKLWFDIQGDTIVVKGHEGRHRSDAIFELLGKDTDMPVDLQFTNNGSEFRARNLTEDIFDKKVVTEDGVKLNKTLRNMFGTASILALINQGESNGTEQ